MHDGVDAVCIHPVILHDLVVPYYWTVIAPFMFSAACGTHW
jgi:hypothetical protein